MMSIVSALLFISESFLTVTVVNICQMSEDLNVYKYIHIYIYDVYFLIFIWLHVFYVLHNSF